MEHSEICPACGGNIMANAGFCSGCGQDLKSGNDGKVTRAAKLSKVNLMILLSSAGVIIIIYFLLQSSPKVDTQTFKHPEIAGQTENPIPDYDEIIARLPQDYASLVNSGNEYMDKRMFPLAIACYERSLDIDSGDANVLTDLGTCYFSMEKDERAIEVFNNVISRFPEHKIAYLNLGIVYFNQKNIDKTRQFWGMLIEKFPEDPLADTVIKYLEQLNAHP